MTSHLPPPTSTTTMVVPRNSLPLVGSCLQSGTPTKMEEETQSDSGYGSNDSSQLATPDRLGNGDGYTVPPENGLALPVSKSKTFTVFQCRIDDVYTARFYHIQPEVSSLLLKYTNRKSLLRSSIRHKPMAMRSMLVGSTALDAKPHIVVFCAPDMRKRIQHFFDTDTLVKAFYKPADPSLPKFEVTVSGCAPQLRMKDEAVCVVWELETLLSNWEDLLSAEIKTGERVGMCLSSTKTKFGNTLCGTPIQFQANGKRRNATMGGIVRLLYDNGTSTLMGLTAGHGAAACLQDDKEHFEADDSETDSFLGDIESECSYGDSEVQTVPELDETPCIKDCTEDCAKSDSWMFSNSHSSGNAILPRLIPVQDESNRPFFDWALVPLDRVEMNELPVGGDYFGGGIISKYRKQDPVTLDGLSSERVILMSGSSGLGYGRLISQPSSILISPGNTFVNTWMITLDSGAALTDGDSGTWVISQETRELLGHVVATDPLGAGYIIPASGIFRDIAEHTESVVVLPSEADISATMANGSSHDLSAENLARYNLDGNASPQLEHGMIRAWLLSNLASLGGAPEPSSQPSTVPSQPWLFAHIGSSGNESNRLIQDLDQLSIGEGDGENTFYPSLDVEEMINGSFFEPPRRRRFATSTHSASTGLSSSNCMAGSRHDPAGQGDGNGSIFSSEGDGMTKASRSSSGSIARPIGHAANLATMVEEEDERPQMPELLTVEPVTGPQLTGPHHWYHAGSTPMTTAIANISSLSLPSSTLIGEPFTNRRGRSDPTVVAILPCELQPYIDCPRTFNLFASEAGIDEWIDHSVKEHLAMLFPVKASCWFCSKQYEVAPTSGLEPEIYRRRMWHIACHLLNNERLSEIRRLDPDLLRHLHERGILQGGAGHEHGIEFMSPRVTADTSGPVTISTVPVTRLRLQDVHIEVAGRRSRD